MPNFNDNNLTPLTGFWCLPMGRFTDYDREVLTDIYLPLIGPSAFALYQLLWQKVPNKEIVTDRESHTVLLSELGIDTREFYEARIKLEAMSLIRTYEKHDELGDYLIYQLIEPQSPSQFINDNILSIFLLENIGETQYNKIVAKYSQKLTVLENSHEISKVFSDIYHISSKVNAPPATITESQEGFPQNKRATGPKTESVVNNDLDYELIGNIVARSAKVTREDLTKNQKLINDLHTLYGLNEVNLGNAIAKSTSLITNQIDPVALQNLVEQHYERKVNIGTRVASEPLQKADGNFDKNDPQSVLLYRAKTTSPADFLAEEQHQNNNAPGLVESRALRTMNSRSVLSAPVLNILIHYVLQSSPTLTLPLMETMANDWRRHDVKTPEDALKRIEEHQNRPRGNSRNFNGPKKVEQSTDWSKVKSQPVDNGNEAEAEKKRQEMLCNLRNKGK